MSLHPSVNTSYGSALEATQASAVPARAMTLLLPAPSRVLIRRPFRHAVGVPLWFNRTSHLFEEYSYDRSAQTRTRHLPPSR